MDSAQITLRSVSNAGSRAARWLAALSPLLDRLLKIRDIDVHYRQSGLAGLPPLEFAAGALRALGVTFRNLSGPVTDRIPGRGPVLVVCNHPYGGIEALILAALLREHRPDLRFLANGALRVFREFAPALIATNPLRVTQGNLRSIRECEAHLRAGGVLVVFPAGRVSYRRPEGQRITDGEWNRLVGHLALRTDATLVPVLFRGANSEFFQRAGRLWERAKLLLLPREFLRLRGRRIGFSIGHAVPPALWRHLDAPAVTAYARVLTYLEEQCASPTASPRPTRVLAPLAARGDAEAMSREIAALPTAQRLLDFKQFSVFHAAASQIPELMQEIARERERVFRGHDEGSGESRDGDRYDQTYVQLFVWDQTERALVGAYRMGRTDLLRQSADPCSIYLSQMFEFDATFYEGQPPSLELGRSFVVPEHQKSFHALYLLWQGIGRYLIAYPQYRRLYGTVSLSRQYDDRAISVLCDALIEPSPQVRPRHPLTHPLHPEWLDYRVGRGRLPLAEVSALVRALDDDGKDLPILLKHYHKLGARFHCVGVDPNFSDTPGLLLSVDVPRLEPKLLATFLGAAAGQYRSYGDSDGRQLEPRP